ncbi:putative pentatricopeptide repeat-containing protein At3g01580 [Selaginella moellendorffii]|uniref:putative pentatricopeptide repeat-containing protein At3g01580 n=1 Tax=Selaginella moellendorffii TaxID=88036 RepID=UPI000D1CB1FC|nr:putative pentatricopeptide repeat-containing protein At3g01580 [Selaginella moellendorffii]|eukprot:XP_024541824.1 putative pentatricopeptide repeat-containing protein At3g01580 [Selaginella moellendorffii]
MLMAMAVDNAGTWGKCSVAGSSSSSRGQSRKKLGCKDISSTPLRNEFLTLRKKSSRCSVVSASTSSTSPESFDKRKLSEAVSKLELAETVSATSYGQLLRACGELKALEEGRRVHAHIEKRGMDKDLYVRYSLIRMYLRCRGASGLADAKRLFFSMKRRDVILWTEMIGAHARLGQSDAALELYKRMRVEGVMPNKVTFLTLLGACSSREKLPDGRVVHKRIVEQGLESDVAVANALLKMYIACGSLEDASTVFEAMKQRDVVSWTTMIMSHGQDGTGKEAVKLFRRMLVEGLKPDCIACVALINACASGMVLDEGRFIHGCVRRSGFYEDVSVGTSLINMYGKCGSVEEAKAVFDEFSSSHTSVVFWTAMMATYAQNGRSEALHLFRAMQLQGIRPNEMTFATVMNSCASYSTLEEGRAVHALIVESGFDSDPVVANSIVTMYGRCGELVEAGRMFDKMLVREASTWNAMITACAQHGLWDEALKLFYRMKQLGEKPNNITLVGVLSACAHAGLVEEGCNNFATMHDYFGVRPTLQHYGCMVDLLGRAGWLREAEEMIKTMPFQADAAMWTAFFGACKTHGDVEGARRAAEIVMELEPNNTGMLEFLRAQSFSESASSTESSEEQEAKAGELKKDACLQPGSSTEEADIQPASTESAAPDEPVRGKANLDAEEEESEEMGENLEPASIIDNTGKQREGKSAGLEAADDMEDQHPDGPGEALLHSWDSQASKEENSRLSETVTEFSDATAAPEQLSEANSRDEVLSISPEDAQSPGVPDRASNGSARDSRYQGVQEADECSSLTETREDQAQNGSANPLREMDEELILCERWTKSFGDSFMEIFLELWQGGCCG